MDDLKNGLMAAPFPCGLNWKQRGEAPLSKFRADPVRREIINRKSSIINPSRPHGAALKEPVFQSGQWLVPWRARRQLARCLMIQSVKARSNPMSCPAFSDSIHLCLRISSRSAWNSRYSDEFFSKSSAGDAPFIAFDIENVMQN